ncbi:MAG TPA: SEC-C metal-binding domain-containing protein [Planctomycetota bacterium]|nr:SEC-C metal-binding domain-containing protein [Planctomycetota bacterium]
MDSLVGTRNCPHLGFDLQGGRPCCHADDMTRQECGRFAPNPAARKSGADSAMTGVEAHFCTVLGTDAIPAEALRLAEDDKRRARQHSREAGPKFRPPGQAEALPARDQHDGEQPVIPTHTIRAEGKQVGPNAPCPCGSGKKFKKCCGGYGA